MATLIVSLVYTGAILIKSANIINAGWRELVDIKDIIILYRSEVMEEQFKNYGKIGTDNSHLKKWDSEFSFRVGSDTWNDPAEGFFLLCTHLAICDLICLRI